MTAVESLPLWIGPPDRPLFAWLDVPDDGLAVGVAVICPSMGLEAAYLSRALRSLARQIAGNRWAALRVDYAATGDSVGSWTDPDLVAEWLGNIRLAIDTARTLARRGWVWWGSGSAPHWRPPSSPAAGRWTTWCSGIVRDGESLSPGAGCPCRFPAQARRRAARRAEGRVRESRQKLEDGLVEAPGAVFSGVTATDLAPLAVHGATTAPLLGNSC